MDTYSWILANIHFDTYTWILTLAHSHLDTDTWIPTAGYFLTYAWILALAYSHLDVSHFLRAHHLCTPIHFPTHTNSLSPFTRGENAFGPLVVYFFSLVCWPELLFRRFSRLSRSYFLAEHGFRSCDTYALRKKLTQQKSDSIWFQGAVFIYHPEHRVLTSITNKNLQTPSWKKNFSKLPFESIGIFLVLRVANGFLFY